MTDAVTYHETTEGRVRWVLDLRGFFGWWMSPPILTGQGDEDGRFVVPTELARA